MAVQRIEKDQSRFREIVKGSVRENLKKYISQGQILGREGGKVVPVPIPQIEIPRFKFGDQNQQGVGSGDGEEGDVLQQEGEGEGQGGGKAGKDPGEHDIEVDVPIDDLAEILGEELRLPRIKPKGAKSIQTEHSRYTGIAPVGPESLRHVKRTFKKALKRQIASGSYNPDDPIIIPVREDKVFRAPKTKRSHEANAAIVYMMDVSGSMGDEQKRVVRIESFWIDTWLRHNYKGVVSRYIIHDARAREVDRETFFHTRESGGTMISSAYAQCADILDNDYPQEDWNIYLFHFSDGDNWSQDDTDKSLGLLTDSLLPRSNLFCYGQVKSPYGSGQFIKDLEKQYPEDERVVLSRIDDRDGIVDSIRDFFSQGR